MYEDETDAELASIEIAEETTHVWYKDKFASVAASPNDHPYSKIVHGRLSIYHPNPMIEDLMEDEDAWKLVLPAEKRENALLESHAEPTAGHLGRAFIAILLLAVHAPKSCKLRAQLLNLPTMQGATDGAGWPHGPPPAVRPWQNVAGDIMGPLPKSPRGYEYLLVFMNLFFRWIECAPIRKANAQTIRRELNERVFLRFGLPEIFHSDNGTEFKNKALDNFLKEHGVMHTTIPPYHTQANPP